MYQQASKINLTHKNTERLRESQLCRTILDIYLLIYLFINILSLVRDPVQYRIKSRKS